MSRVRTSKLVEANLKDGKAARFEYANDDLSVATAEVERCRRESWLPGFVPS